MTAQKQPNGSAPETLTQQNLEKLLFAARQVIINWETSNLAEAVRQLSFIAHSIEEGKGRLVYAKEVRQ